MFKRIFLATVALALLDAKLPYCQGPPKTPEQFLAQAGIPLDTNSLIQALHDKRAGVVAASASVLADRHATNAIPELTSRMEAENNPQLQVTLAQSLNILGAEDGTKLLESICLNRNADSGVRIRAADDLADTGDYHCLAAIASYLNSRRPDEKQAALLYLLKIPSEQDSQPISLGSSLLTIAIHDSDEQFRDLARKVIEQIGDPTTKNALRELRQENPKK
jgi:HEAT repeat protein